MVTRSCSHGTRSTIAATSEKMRRGLQAVVGGAVNLAPAFSLGTGHVGKRQAAASVVLPLPRPRLRTAVRTWRLPALSVL